jgi:phenylalanyl-tRNA synthetase beta chain
MKLSLNWINDFVDLPAKSAKELSERLTLGTAEVEEVQEVGHFWTQLKVAQVEKIDKHPEADKLNLVTFSIGNETRQVVCGASNVRVGMKTIFAPTGVTLPIGLTLEPKKIRGVVSEGMLCSEEELGLASSSEGILDLPVDAPVGELVSNYWKKSSDRILDIDNKSLTHRPDLWGHYGFAREFSALYQLPLKDQFSADWEKRFLSLIPGDPSPVRVRFSGESAGVAYFGLSVVGVVVGESPDWMKERLQSAGLRPINSLVDISNYVMLELGSPMHFFDRKKIKGDEVVIHELAAPASFTTLDEVERPLIAGDTVISDSSGPLVLAGIMGGLNSGVDESTTELFIEVANWKPAMVRRTSTRLGLRTDSSQRFEKSLDSLGLKRTMLRALELVLEFNPNAKIVGSLEYAGIDLATIKPLVLKLDCLRAKRVLGKDLSVDEMARILGSLDFQCTKKGDTLEVVVPSFRATKDIEVEADLIEELGRVIGYDSITPVSPLLPVAPARLTLTQELHRKVRDFMSLHGHSFEVMTYPLIGKKLLDRALWNAPSDLTLINSLSTDHDQMRPSLIPSALEACALNAKNFEEFSFFELGRVYGRDKKSFATEQTHLLMGRFDHKESPFLEVCNTAERLLATLNAPYDLDFHDLVEGAPKNPSPLVDWNWTGLHPFEITSIRLMGRYQGLIFSVHPLVMRAFKMKGHLSFLLLNLAPLEERPMKDKTKYTPLAKFPGSRFDCTVVADKQASVGSIVQALKSLKSIKELQSTRVVDVFSLNETQKAVTLRTEFLDRERTLDGTFLAGVQQQVIGALEQAGYPLKT